MATRLSERPGYSQAEAEPEDDPIAQARHWVELYTRLLGMHEAGGREPQGRNFERYHRRLRHWQQCLER